MSYLELGGYFVAIVTGQRRGAWCAWAEFEQDIEWGERSIHVPVYRHRVPGTFPNEFTCFRAGVEYAQQTLAEGTVAIN
ncbi:hypothetical protein [Variovorax atrisoli]|uniref:hypothetical protein n=1 Tax=Variovorax atrisoli TaxID=3394203 RepID=UPI00339231B2